MDSVERAIIESEIANIDDEIMLDDDGVAIDILLDLESDTPNFKEYEEDCDDDEYDEDLFECLEQCFSE